MSAFVDDTTLSSYQRVAAFRAYLVSINFESLGQGTIDQAVANWAAEKGFPEAAMGGRRSRRTRRSKGRKGRKTRSHKK
jgi:hypothetical protein